MPMTDAQHAQARGFLADPGTDCQQSIEIDNAASGTFTITFNGQTTTPIPFNAGANVVQNALTALSSIGLGNVYVNQQPGIPTALIWVAYFTGTLAGQALPMFTLDTSLLVPIIGETLYSAVALVQPGGIAAFANADLDNLYDLGDSNFFLAIAYGYRELAAGGARFNDYVAGQSQEKKSQIFAQLSKLADFYFEWAFADRQVQTSKLQAVPPRLRAVPRMIGTTAMGLSYGPPYGPTPWNKNGPWGW